MFLKIGTMSCFCQSAGTDSCFHIWSASFFIASITADLPSWSSSTEIPSSPGTLPFQRRRSALTISASGDDGARGICSRMSSMGFSQLSTSKKCSTILLSLWDMLVSRSTPFFTRSEGAAGLETQLCRRHSSQIRDPPWIFCSATLMCSSASAALVLHLWFLAFSAALLVRLCKMLYCRCCSGKMGLFTLALRKRIHASLFFLNRLVSSFNIQSCTRTEGRSGSPCSASMRASLRDCYDTSTVLSS